MDRQEGNNISLARFAPKIQAPVEPPNIIKSLLSWLYFLTPALSFVMTHADTYDLGFKKSNHAWSVGHIQDLQNPHPFPAM